MISSLTMKFYHWKEGDKIIIQNMVGGMKGQKHTHTPEDFKRWKKGINKEDLINMDKK